VALACAPSLAYLFCALQLANLDRELWNRGTLNAPRFAFSWRFAEVQDHREQSLPPPFCHDIRHRVHRQSIFVFFFLVLYCRRKAGQVNPDSKHTPAPLRATTTPQQLLRTCTLHTHQGYGDGPHGNLEDMGTAASTCGSPFRSPRFCRMRSHVVAVVYVLASTESTSAGGEAP
jgi:hypothetical protein